MKSNPEKIEQLKQVTIQALHAASAKHDELGKEGTMVITTKFPSHPTEYTKVLSGDLEVEKTIIKIFEDAGIPVRFYSEEHGQVDLATRPQFIVTLDGLDGSKHYQEEFNVGKYATLITIFKGTNPTYNDYLVCGYFEHPAKRLMYAVKNQGTFLVDQDHPNPTRVHTSGRIQFTPDTSTSIDGYFDINLRTFADKLTGFSKVSIGTPETGGYSGVAYADIARGDLDLCLECTRKGNLELAMGYGLLKEADGAIILLDGTNLGRKRFLTFGQGSDEHIPTIAAATKELANEAKDFFIPA